MKKYVVGFAFSEGLSEVLLIEKKKPVWQAGLLNGLGGSIEKDDPAPVSAMVREFEEECGIQTKVTDWGRFAKLGSEGLYEVHCFVATGIDIYQARITTDEKPRIIQVDMLKNFRTVPNLCWLIPMALLAKKEDFSFISSTFYS